MYNNISITFPINNVSYAPSSNILHKTFNIIQLNYQNINNNPNVKNTNNLIIPPQQILPEPPNKTLTHLVISPDPILKKRITQLLLLEKLFQNIAAKPTSYKNIQKIINLIYSNDPIALIIVEKILTNSNL